MRASLKLVAAGLYLGTLLNLTAQSLSTVQFVSASYSVSENAGSVTLTVQRTGPPGGHAYVEFETGDGTAAAGFDYVAQRGTLVFFGETNLTILVPILNDGVAEPDKGFVVRLFNPDPFDNELGAIASAMVTILDDERLGFTSLRFGVRENEGSVLLTVSRGDVPAPEFQVQYWTFDGTATAGSDYVAQQGTLVFEAGESNKTITVPIVDDTTVERAERFYVYLNGPWPADITVLTAAVTILDDDPGVEFNATTYTVDEGAGIAAITVNRTTDFTNEFSVDYFADGCGATAAQNGTLNFSVGETEKSILIPIRDDGLLQGNTTVLLRLSNPVSTSLGVQTNAALVIRDHGQANIPDMEVTPHRLGMWSRIGTDATAIAVAGNYAYLGGSTFQVFDMGDPANPKRVGECSDVSGIADMVVSGGYAYVAERAGALEIIDISVPSHPARVGHYAISNSAVAVTVAGRYGYVTAWNAGLEVFDLGDPTNPQRVGGYAFQHAFDVAVSGTFAYLLVNTADSAQLEIVDLSNPANPQRIGALDLPSSVLIWAKLLVSGNYAYLFGSDLRVIDITDPANPQSVGSHELWSGYVNDAVLDGGFGYLTVEGELVVLDLAQPLAPKRVGSYAPGPSSALAVSGGRAYVIGSFGLDVLDIQMPTNVVRLGGFTALTGAAEVAVAGNYVYEVGHAGLVILDASDVTNPRLIGRAGTRSPGTGVMIACNRAFVGEQRGLEVFDVSDPANPRRVGAYNHPHCSGSTASSFEGNLATLTVLPDVYCGGGGGGIDLIDLSDPANLQRIGSYRRTDDHTSWGTWDVALSGNRAYVATAYPQLQVINISDPADPQQVVEARLVNETAAYDLTVSGHDLYLNLGGGLAVMNISSLASPQGGVITGRVDGLQLGRFVAAGGRLCGVAPDGLHVIDVRDSTNPSPIQFYQTDAPATAVAVTADRAYLATMTGLEILDLNPFLFVPGSVTRLADGQVQFTLNTRAGQSYTVQTSTNLVDWESLETRIAADSKLIFTDTNAVTFDRRFYRAVSP
jgi:hypothetical protein